MNLCIIIGNLTRDPELTYVGQNETAKCRMGVAVNNGKDKDGTEREATFFDVECWQALAERCAEYLRKGRKVSVQGRMERQTWEKDGETKTRWVLAASNVEFLSPRQEGDEQPAHQARRGPQPARQAEANYDDLDDLPF